MTRSSFSKEDYEILAKETLFQGFYRMLRYQVRHKKFEGGWSVPFARELLDTLSAVALLLYDPLRDEVVLIEQFRIGALNHFETPWIVENVAGFLMPGEPPIDAVKREALEESGCEVLDIEPIYEYLASPGNSNEYLYLYCGWVDATTANGIFGLEEEHEDIRVLTIPTIEAFAMLQRGEIKTAHTILALLWLQLNQERLKAKWQKK